LFLDVDEYEICFKMLLLHSPQSVVHSASIAQSVVSDASNWDFPWDSPLASLRIIPININTQSTVSDASIAQFRSSAVPQFLLFIG